MVYQVKKGGELVGYADAQKDGLRRLFLPLV